MIPYFWHEKNRKEFLFLLSLFLAALVLRLVYVWQIKDYPFMFYPSMQPQYFLAKSLAIVQGDLAVSFLTQLITDWMGEWGTIRRLHTSNRGMLFPNEDVFCKGKVSRKYIENDENYVECEVWTENSQGERCTEGTVTVAFPSRGHDTIS